MRCRHLALILCSALRVSPAAAQAVQPWPTLNINAGSGHGVLAAGEFVGRIATSDTRPTQAEARVLVGHPLTHRLTGWIGVAHIVTYPSSGRAGLDTNVVEQLSWAPAPLGRLHVAVRGRLEERFLRGASGVSWRARTQLRLAMPLGRPSAVAWTEPFFGLNRTTGQPSTLDTLRNFVGISLPLSKRAGLEFGYLNQRVNRPAGAIVTHAVPLVLTVRL